MCPTRPLCLLVLLVGSAGPPAATAQGPGAGPTEDVLTRPSDDRRDLTLLYRVSERTFAHAPSRVSYAVPAGWKEIRPHRLARKIDRRISTVLGIERGDRDLVASLYWIPMDHGQDLSTWVRAEPLRGEYGEEYETLKAVYGTARLSTPTRSRHGPFDVYSITIQGDPDRGRQYDGSLFVFAVESGGTTWLLKARVSYPQADRGQHDRYATELLGGYARLPDRADGGPERKP